MRARVGQLRREVVFDRIVACFGALRRAGASRIGEDLFRVTHFSVQDDHVHLIVEANDRGALFRGAQGLAIRLARRVNTALRRRGALWNERYHARVLRTPTEVRSALVYVLHNRKKHGLLAGALDPMSSAAWFGAWSDLGARVGSLGEARSGAGCVSLGETRAGPDPVAPPRSWLLSEGWRRSGLLSVHEAPRRPRGARRERVAR